MTQGLSSGASASPPTPADRIAAAERFIAERRLDEAQAVLSGVLEASPDDAAALNAMGAVALARPDPRAAFDILSAAATCHPGSTGIANNLGIAHQMAGRLDEAVICFERALALAPGTKGPLLSLANASFLRGDPVRARILARQLLALDPNDASALALLGLVDMAAGRLEKADQYLRLALERSPDDPSALRGLSALCFERRLFEDALALAERFQLAAPLDLDGAEQVARCQAALGRYAEAEAALRRLLAVSPNHSGASEILARIQIVTGRAEAGIAMLSRLVRIAPRDLRAISALAAALRFAGRLDEAAGFARHALKLAPEDAGARALLREIELAAGRFPPPEAMSEPDARVVVVPEHLPAADVVLFSRYLCLDRRDGAPVRVAAPAHVQPLLARLSTAIVFEELSADDAAFALPALAPAFGFDPGELPVQPPYLSARPETRARWARALGEYPGPKVGLLWSGGGAGFSMTQLRAALPPGVTPVSLMSGAARHDLRDWAEAIDAGVAIDGFGDMLAVIAELDLVIGPDVSALHLAGAMARPAIVLVTAGFHWSWVARESRSLWYPSVEVIAQGEPGDWCEPLARCSERLRTWLERPPTPPA